MAFRGHRSSRVFTSRRRGTFWGRSPADTGITTLAAATAVIDSSAVPLTQSQTLIRTRGQIIIQSDQTATSEQPVGAVGMAVVSSQSVAVGVGSVPTPYTDQDSDLWVMHQYFATDLRFETAIGFQSVMRVFEFDSKAMRKMEDGQTLIFVVENGHATHGLQYYLQFATLFKAA